MLFSFIIVFTPLYAKIGRKYKNYNDTCNRYITKKEGNMPLLLYKPLFSVILIQRFFLESIHFSAFEADFLLRESHFAAVSLSLLNKG